MSDETSIPQETIPQDANSSQNTLINKPAVESLDAFVQSAAKRASNNQPIILPSNTSVPSEAVFSLGEEVLLAKHVITFFAPLVERLSKKVSYLHEKQQHVELNADEKRVLLGHETHLIKVGEQLQESLNKVARLVKQAVEVEAIKSSRLDSVQLLTILNQIPTLISDLVRASLVVVIDEIQQTVEANFISDAHVRDLHNKCRFFGRLRDIAIDETIHSLLEQINTKLAAVKVAPGNSSNSDGEREGVLLEELSEMLETVPSEK